jgi:hypothetical protein
MGMRFLFNGTKIFYELDMIYAVTFSALAIIGGSGFSMDRLIGF